MQIATGIKIDTKIRVFGVICSHMTACSHLQHLQHWCPRRFGIKATLPPAFRNRSSSPSAAPAAAKARAAISPPSEHQPHWSCPTGREPFPSSPEQANALGTGTEQRITSSQSAVSVLHPYHCAFLHHPAMLFCSPRLPTAVADSKAER